METARLSLEEAAAIWDAATRQENWKRMRTSTAGRYGELGGWIASKLYRSFGWNSDRQLAEDVLFDHVVDEVRVQFFERVAKGIQKTNPRGYLRTIVLCTTARLARRRYEVLARSVPLEDGGRTCAADVDATHRMNGIREFLLEEVERRMATLPESDRQLLAAKAAEGGNGRRAPNGAYKSVAAVLKISESTARVRACRTAKRLAAELRASVDQFMEAIELLLGE